MIRCLALAMIIAAPAAAHLSSADLANAGVTPRSDARLPDGAFVDQFGHRATLATNVPTILLFADYTCGHLCGPGITLTAGGLHDAGLVPGRDYRLTVIGLDQDGPAAARALIAARLASLPAEAHAIRLLSGDSITIAATERDLGYRAIYDPATDQFAHSAATYVFTPSGRLSRVLPETASTAEMLRGAVETARKGDISSEARLQGLITLCYGFAAAHGLYGSTIVAMLRMAALATVAGLGILIWRLRRRERAV